MELNDRRDAKRTLRRVPKSDVTRIAVIDDDDGMRRLLRNVFESSGYAVSEGRDEAELMAVLKTHTIALITLDLSLGYEDSLLPARFGK